ncbi:MAG TPA: hypothetical protein VKB88_10585 [Bryobacteraceae bacterium]|nr:hypothetical protein [Bryobacteraceae bacterium]
MSTIRSAAASLTLGLGALHGQYAAPPDVYTVVQVNSMMGTSATMTVYRDGSRAIVDNSANGTPVRSYYDLVSKKTVSWNPRDSSTGCSNGTFGGSWGDPFEASTEVTKELAQKHAAPVGAETVNGFATKVYELDVDGGGKARAWVDTKYGLTVKLQMAQSTILEVKQAAFARPAASIFAIPPSCAAALAAPTPPTEAERIAAETGGNPEEFLNAVTSQSSPNSCTVLFRVVHAGSMQPIAGGFQLAIDTAYDIDHPPHYVTGVSPEGHLTYSGGGITEVTAQLQQGAYRIDNAPKSFYLDLGFGRGGESSALIHRQCFGPQTMLLLVVKNHQKLSDGADWLWVKSGKYAR